MSRPTVTIYHDTRKPLKSGKYPVVISVTFKFQGKWITRPFTCKIALSKLEWAKIKSRECRGELRDIGDRIFAEEERAKQLINDNPKIEPDRFRELYTGQSSQSAIVKSLFTELIASMQKEGRISSADSYKDSMTALVSYGGDGLTLDQIDKDWLKGFERHRKDLSPSTIGIYLRNLRAVFHVAIDRKIISADLYPFGRKRYVIPSSRNIKKALTEADKNKLLSDKPANRREAKALSDWAFSYFCNGMNFSDMAHIRKEYIRGDTLTFRRNKTARNKRDAMPLIVILRRETLEILRDKTGDPFLFGIIDETDSPKRRKAKIKQWVKTTNKWLGKICERLGIETVKTYTARHTAATMLKRGGTDILDIRDALGHSSVTTTELYLKSLDLDEKRKMSERL